MDLNRNRPTVAKVLRPGREVKSRRIIATCTEMLLLVSGILLLANTNKLAVVEEANAQLPSVLPPPPSGSIGKDGSDRDLRITADDRSPPIIEVLTTELKQGKNILVVKITDASDLKSKQLEYVNEGRIKLSDLNRDHQDVYHALVDVDQPSSIIVIDIIDAAGNRVSVIKEFRVVEEEPGDYLGLLVRIWNNLLAFLGLR